MKIDNLMAVRWVVFVRVCWIPWHSIWHLWWSVLNSMALYMAFVRVCFEFHGTLNDICEGLCWILWCSIWHLWGSVLNSMALYMTFVRVCVEFHGTLYDICEQKGNVTDLHRVFQFSNVRHYCTTHAVYNSMFWLMFSRGFIAVMRIDCNQRAWHEI
jgi:hypothetical protein